MFYSAFIILMGFIFSVGVQAAELVKRQVDIELESVEDATLYEIELQSKSSGHTQNFKMHSPHWRAMITPGEYILRLRSYDIREVPGAWNEPIPFTVKLAGPRLLEPEMNAQIKTTEEDEYEVTLKWQDVPGTKKYRVEVMTSGGGKMTDSTKNSVKIKLPVAKKYNWKVTPISKNGTDGESQDVPGTFTLIGRAPMLSIIEKPEDVWVEKLKWDHPKLAERFNYILQKEEKDKWVKIEKKDNFTEAEIPFSVDYPGGHYRLGVQATSALRENSKFAIMEFDVFSGDRSPSAVEEAKLRHSLEKPTNWYFIASYLLTKINYSGVSPDDAQGNTATQISYPNATSGTGRLGLGYINSDNHRGYLLIGDLSGIIIDNQRVTYKSAEAHYVWRYTWGRNMIRPSTGIFYKELVETRPSLGAGYSNSIMSFIGPHAGFDFWRPLTLKYGVQTNARLYYGWNGISTPQDRQQIPELSYQLGLMGSYKIKQHITGFMGWAHRLDKGSYRSASSSTTGSAQQVNLQGDYINFLLEWGF